MWEGVFKYVHFIIKGSGGVKMLEVLVYIQNDSQKLVELIIVEVDVNTFLFKKQNKKIFFSHIYFILSFDNIFLS